MSWGHPDGDLVRMHDGVLDDRAAVRLREHLARCARCRELDETIVFSRRALASFPPAEAHADDRARARAAMLEAIGRDSLPRPASRRWMLAAAAVLLLIGLGWLLTPHVRFVDAPATPRSIETLALSEARSGRVAERISSIDAVRERVAAHSGVRPRLQPIAHGERRILGITPASLGGAPAATIVYEVDGHPVVLVVARASRLADAPPSLLRAKRLEIRRGAQNRVFTWSSSGDAYSLAVPNGVAAARACALCHQGTTTAPLIESATRGL